MNRTSIRSSLRALLASAEVALRQNVMDGFIIFTILIQPMLIALMAMWMLRERAADLAIFVVVGSGMSGLWSSLLFVSGNSITSERWTGTLEMLIAQPTSLPVIIFGKNLAHVMQSLLSMIGAYVISALIFGYELSIAQPLAFAVSLLATIIAFISFGLIIAPVFVINPGIQGLQNGLEFPVFTLSGFLFPIALLPGWTTPLSYLLAPYWAARALHATSSGTATPGELLLSLGMLLFFSLVYLAISRKLFQVLVRKAREDATLGFT